MPSTEPLACIAGLEQALDARRSAGLARTRRDVGAVRGATMVVDGREMLAFASNDYLGLSQDPAIVAALADGALRFGAGSGASHLVCGHWAPHQALEDALALYVAPGAGWRALSLSTGYLANLALCTALGGRGDTIFADRLNHASLNDAAVLSRATLVRYPHLDLDALAARLDQARGRPLIVTDAVFSMDGDVAPLARLLALAERHDAWLIVDDAHGFGVLGDGRGSVAQAGLASDRIVIMGTLGKAAGVAGAFVAAHPAVVETLVQTARPYIYSTAAPPALACALDAALRSIADGRERRLRLFALIERFRDGAQRLPWRLLPSSTPIQPLVVGEPQAAVAVSQRLWQDGIFVPAIRPPTVPKGTARLRVSLSAAHAPEDVDRLLAALARAA
jgi:8-amino-7-oxononanoate synthase